jgi:hypothetical protein
VEAAAAATAAAAGRIGLLICPCVLEHPPLLQVPPHDDLSRNRTTTATRVSQIQTPTMVTAPSAQATKPATLGTENESGVFSIKNATFFVPET